MQDELLTQKETKQELARLFREKQKLLEEQLKLDSMIMILTGVEPVTSQRKSRKKTFTAREFARGCGV